MGITNAEFDADFESIEKVEKTHAKKVVNEKVTEKLSFGLFLLFAKISACKFWGFFALFLNGFELGIKVFVFRNPYQILEEETLFLLIFIFKANIR